MEVRQVYQDLIGLSYQEVIGRLEFVEDEGGCCGEAHYTELFDFPADMDFSDLVLRDCALIEYDAGDAERVVFNFIFVDAVGNDVIFGYELYASSGSGWAYGAYVDMLHNDTILASASW